MTSLWILIPIATTKFKDALSVTKYATILEKKCSVAQCTSNKQPFLNSFPTMTSRNDVIGIKQNQICNLRANIFYLRYHSTMSDLRKGKNAYHAPILCVDLLLLWRHRMFQFAKSKRKKWEQYKTNFLRKFKKNCRCRFFFKFRF